MAEAEPITNGGPRFRRVLLKLSGEAMAPAQGNGIDLDALGEIAQEVKDVAALGIELALVIGAGNILRGSEYEARGMDRSTADQMGMLATVINALAMQNALEQLGVTPASSPPSRCIPCASHTSCAARFAISKRAASWSSPPAPAIPISPPIPRRACAQWRSAPTSSSRPATL
jgi:hypothetical protein